MFQLTQLRCFVAVATELHFGRAAASLNMTQPPLTRQIQLLEHEVGVRLLERSGGNVRLTPAGAVFLHEAEDILRRSQAATLAARRAMRADAGSVTMGFIPAASFTLLPQLLAAVHAQLPDVQVVLREMQTVEQVEAIGTDRIELGIVRPFAPRSFTESVAIFREPFVLAMPAEHRLADQASIPLSALEGEAFIEFCPSESRYLYELVAGRLRAEGVAPETVQTLSHTHSILSLVDAGVGVALVPRSAQRLRYAGVEFRSLRDADSFDVELHLVWRRGGRRGVLDTLRNLIQQAYPMPTRQ
ncbi:LysR family transcriptional regulator [Variovorax sp. J22P240]|uniref:LysR family transcriptional regulator n=1 Tax=unclassified Variovorax TaxID=663243 RepID=UPI002575AE45|nr:MULTISPECIES: LysR family transcriptional regulator [unclassified Variovorax]MDM0001665.1 LysR family transcriptional regulator [Variovorax sp. J22P240]MDM0053428.1 LysR family transcriptional regulator [Variovorax sp. J22R115]